MLWIIFEDGSTTDWKIERGLFNIPSGIFVKEVQADGDELEYIRDEFSNLPQNTLGKKVKWFGDHAKFIAHNLV